MWAIIGLVSVIRKGWDCSWKEIIKLWKGGIKAGKGRNPKGKRLIAQADCLIQWVELSWDDEA